MESSIRDITDVSMKLQSKRHFRNALKEKNRTRLTRIVDNEFNQHIFTTGDIELQRIYVLDKDLNVLVKSSKGMTHSSDNGIMCERIIGKAEIRVASNRLKTLSMLCDDEDVAHLAILNVVGCFKSQGYLLYIVNPASLLSSLGDRMGMSAQILNPNGSVAYSTADWEESAHNDQSNYLNVYHAVNNDNRQPVLFINILHDLKEFNASLNKTKKSSLITATLIFSIALALSFLLLNAVIRALKSIKQGAKSFSKGKFETVTKTHISEFNILIDAFNGMASDISALIKKLNQAKQNSEQASYSHIYAIDIQSVMLADKIYKLSDANCLADCVLFCNLRILKVIRVFSKSFAYS